MPKILYCEAYDALPEMSSAVQHWVALTHSHAAALSDAEVSRTSCRSPMTVAKHPLLYYTADSWLLRADSNSGLRQQFVWTLDSSLDASIRRTCSDTLQVGMPY